MQDVWGGFQCEERLTGMGPREALGEVKIAVKVGLMRHSEHLRLKVQFASHWLSVCRGFNCSWLPGVSVHEPLKRVKNAVQSRLYGTMTRLASKHVR
jgi:hypothetical protein